MAHGHDVYVQALDRFTTSMKRNEFDLKTENVFDVRYMNSIRKTKIVEIDGIGFLVPLIAGMVDSREWTGFSRGSKSSRISAKHR